MRRVVFNKKGGVGKTTIVCNLAAAAALTGQRTLVVDLDPQANTTRYLLGEGANAIAPTVKDLLEESLGLGLIGERRPSSAFVHETPFPNLSLIPSHRELEGLMGRLESRLRVTRLREFLRDVEADQVLIDTPPALNVCTLSALIAAQRCLIPFDCDEFSRHALYGLKGHVRQVASEKNPDLRLEGVVVNQFQPRARLPKRLVDELEREGFELLRPFLGSSVIIRESHQSARPLVHLAPRHKLSAAFRELWRTLCGTQAASVKE
jgi:chromosome partitioning protein